MSNMEFWSIWNVNYLKLQYNLSTEVCRNYWKTMHSSISAHWYNVALKGLDQLIVYRGIDRYFVIVSLSADPNPFCGIHCSIVSQFTPVHPLLQALVTSIGKCNPSVISDYRIDHGAAGQSNLMYVHHP